MTSLARINGRVTSLSEMPGRDIAAALSSDQRAEIAAKLGNGATNASSSPARSRIAIVAHACANDATCKGKAGLALEMLADDEMASISGNGIVKLLRASGTVDQAADAAADMRKAIAEAYPQGQQAQNHRATVTTAASNVWDRAITSMEGN